MKIINQGNMPNGIKVQVEDWREDYKHLDCLVVAYPTSIGDNPEYFAHKKGQTFRLEIKIPCGELSIDKANNIFNLLINGEKSLQEFKDSFRNKEDINFLPSI